MKRSAIAAVVAATLAGGIVALKAKTSACVMRMAGGTPDGCMRAINGTHVPPRFGEPFPARQAWGAECVSVECPREP